MITPENTKKPIIVIADDLPEDIKALVAFLEQSGFRVEVARNGESAITRLEQSPQDLILVDAPTIRTLQEQLQAQNTRLQKENERLKQERAKRKHVEEALKASEDRYRAVVEDQMELICRFSPDGDLTFVNQAYCRYVGKTPEALMGTPFFAFVLEEDQEIVKMHLTSLGQDRPVGTLEYRLIQPDGNLRWQQWTTHLIVDERGHKREFQAVGREISGYKEVEDILERYHEQVYDLVIERTRDLTQSNERLQHEIAEHRRVERALEGSEAQYRTLYEEAPNGYFSVGPDGTIKRCNRAASDLLGYTREELLEMHVFELYADLPDGLPKARTIFQRFLAGEDIHDEELQMQRKDETLVWISLTVNPVRDQMGQVIESRSMVIDITQRKLAEQSLHLSEQQYRLLAERVADGVGIVQEGKLVFVNQALASLFRYPPDHLFRIDPLELIREDYQEQGRQRRASARKKMSESSWQVPCMTNDGREIWVEARQRGIEWQGKPAFLVTVRDITERKRQEIAIKEERNHLRRENITLRTAFQERYKFGAIIGKSSAMQKVYQAIAQAAASNANVIISGKSGTGKDLVAQTIHHLSKRKAKAFVVVNCSAVPENLFEREFFGHRKGTFTGADQDQPGYFDQAHKGTLFLNEVGELTPTMQAKLLHVLENKAYTPLGETRSKKVDVRIIAATNKDLDEQLRKGVIREDFFYRIHIIVINLSPLRDRREDIPLLVDHFLKDYSEGKECYSMMPGHIIEALCTYDWPGNVRELQNELQRYLSNQPLEFIGNGAIAVEAERDMVSSMFESAERGLREVLEAFEKRVIAATLARNHWKTKATAEILGITQRSLQRKIKKYQII